ncbi:MAG: helix-turn-helix domain-containing protein [Defluviitaleaceae bacterium]|nr:helix-turn-helix domain-containing protein [Defluviitaleaceae bacterium]MCL2273345.1 helix-turn-helix domain-containing protein [Defluviitaleaceae bacterium]
MQTLDWKQIGVRLKEQRKKSRITNERLSELVGVSPSFIGLIERASSGVSLENLYKLAQLYSCSIDYLITGKIDIPHSNNTAKFTHLMAALYDYNEEEINTVIELAKLLRGKVEVRQV